MMTDRFVIEAIRRCHLKANIGNPHYTAHDWNAAWVDAGGTIFGRGPYVHLPVLWHGEKVTIRVYPPEHLRRRLAKAWRPAETRET